MKSIVTAVLLTAASAAWAQNEIEHDLDGNASIFQTAPSKPDARKKTEATNAPR